MKPNQTLICVAARDIHNLTQGKEYVCLYRLEEGIFANRPYVTVTGDDGKKLWTEKRGPKNASMEQCNLGLGPGVLKGAYAQLPRYFADTGKVQDLESRLITCMETLQGFTEQQAEHDAFANASWMGMAERLGLMNRRLRGLGLEPQDDLGR